MNNAGTIYKQEEKMPEPTGLSDFSFSDLVDIPDLQQLVTHLSELAGCPVGILDVNNTILVASNWQKICTCFHRIHPETKKNCLESDSFIRQNLETKNPIAYKCKNGLWDVAYPIIIEGKHVANIFFGQFFFDDEIIDIPFFENQAKKYGFDKTEYLNSLHEVPVISRKKAETLKNFSSTLAQILTKTGYSNLLLKKEKIEELRVANQQIKESELKFRKFFEQAGVGVVQVDLSSGMFINANKKFADMLGYTIDELLQLTFKDITFPDDLIKSKQGQNRILKKEINEFSIEKRYVRKDGSVFWAMLTASSMGEMEGGNNYQIAIIQDITDRKQNERILKIRNDILKFSIHCTLDQLIQKTIDEIEILTESSIGFFHFVESDQQTLWLQNWSKNTIQNMCTAEGKGQHYSIQDAGVWVDCVYAGKPVIHNDYNSLSHRKGLPEGHATIIREMVVPIFRNEKIVAIIGVGNKLTDYDESQAKVVEELGGMVWEIVERKKAEIALEESEEKFKSIFYQSPIGLQLYNIDGKLLDCNPACLDMFGIDNMNEVIGFNLFKDPNLTEQQKKDIRDGINVRFEIKFDFDLVKKINLYTTKKTGASFFSCFAATFKTNENNKTRFLLHLIDITQRKKAEASLKEENERFHTTMESMDSAVYVADMENHEILFVNEYVKNIFGNITGKKCYSALQGKTVPCDFCTNHLLLDAKGNANKPYVWEFQNLITKRWYQCHDQAICWTNGKLVRFEMATDITENKENEIKLRELNSTKDKLFSIIGHDLRNPFTALISSSELLSIYLEKNDLAKSKAKAAMIANASKNAFSILENLLLWAKSQTGTLKFDPQKINLRDSVAGTIVEVENLAIEKNIRIKNKIPDDLIVKADEHLLSFVFRNLLTNAIKFTHNGGMITVKAKAGNGYVEAAVIDTGIGIPKEHQHKLFRLETPFSREGTANEASTGLGLILCKDFIEKHNGKIWFESKENKGTKFRFSLPYLNQRMSKVETQSRSSVPV